MSSDKPKIHDGYILSPPLEDKLICFYRDSPYNKVVVRPKVYRVGNFKVNEEKIIAYEEMCETCRQNFIELGLLRLHTPLCMHEEHLGDHFLYVPPKERRRIARMLNGRPLITAYNANLSPIYGAVEAEANETLTNVHKELPPGYCVVAKGAEGLDALGLPAPMCVIRYFTLDELIGSGEMSNSPEISGQIREALQKRDIDSDDEVVKRTQTFEEDKFSSVSLEVDGMFIQREKTWLGRIFS